MTEVQTVAVASLLAVTPSCPQDRAAKVAADLTAAFGRAPAIFSGVDLAGFDALANSDEAGDAHVLCHVTDGPAGIAFADCGWDRLVIEMGAADPDLDARVEATAAEAFAWQTADPVRALLDRWLAARGVPGAARVLICTSNWKADPVLARLDLRALTGRMRYLGTPVVACDADTVAAWREAASGLSVVSYQEATGLADVGAVVLLSDGPPLALPDDGIAGWADAIPFWLFQMPQLIPLTIGKKRPKRSLSHATNPQLSHNRFVGEASADGTFGVADTPIGKIRLLTNGLGPVGPFGHRIGGRLADLAQRPANHKVVALFGGSGAFSPRCFHDETIAGHLQARLETAAAGGEIPGTARVSVLNFGEPAGTITDVLTRFSHLGTLVRPDCVIAHIGVNEFGSFGNDPSLVDDFNILYASGVFGEQVQVRPSIEVTPERLAAAVAERLDALARLSAGLGAGFLAGFQPSLCFKRPTAAEQRSLDAAIARRPESKEGIYLSWRVYAEGVRALFELLGPDAAFPWLDLTGPFTPDTEAFYDHVHLTPDGNDIVAGLYQAAVTDILGRSEGFRPEAGRMPIRRPRSTDRTAALLDAEIAAAAADPDLAELAERLRSLRSDILQGAGKPELRGARELARDAYPLD